MECIGPTLPLSPPKGTWLKKLLVATFFTRKWLRYVLVFVFANLSVCRLYVTFVHPQGVCWILSIFLHRYSASALATLWLPWKILYRDRLSQPSGALNARGVTNRAILDLSKVISHKRCRMQIYGLGLDPYRPTSARQRRQTWTNVAGWYITLDKAGHL